MIGVMHHSSSAVLHGSQWVNEQSVRINWSGGRLPWDENTTYKWSCYGFGTTHLLLFTFTGIPHPLPHLCGHFPWWVWLQVGTDTCIAYYNWTRRPPPTYHHLGRSVWPRYGQTAFWPDICWVTRRTSHLQHIFTRDCHLAFILALIALITHFGLRVTIIPLL